MEVTGPSSQGGAPWGDPLSRAAPGPFPDAGFSLPNTSGYNSELAKGNEFIGSSTRETVYIVHRGSLDWLLSPCPTAWTLAASHTNTSKQHHSVAGTKVNVFKLNIDAFNPSSTLVR